MSEIYHNRKGSREAQDTQEDFIVEYEKPLYTEIRIPVPHLSRRRCSSSEGNIDTAPSRTPSKSTKSRSLSHTWSSILPFRQKPSHSSSSDESSPVQHSVAKEQKVHAMLDITHLNKSKGRGAIDALAAVPAVLVLGAELFTPRAEHEGKENRRRDSGTGD